MLFIGFLKQANYDFKAVKVANMSEKSTNLLGNVEVAHGGPKWTDASEAYFFQNWSNWRLQPVSYTHEYLIYIVVVVVMPSYEKIVARAWWLEQWCSKPSTK